MDYRRRLQMALDAQRQRSAVTGRPLAPQEVGEINEAAIAPYAQQYGQNYLDAMRLQQQQKQWNKMYDLRRKALKQEEEAQKIAGYTEIAKLGLGAGMLAGRYYKPRPAPATSTEPAAPPEARPLPPVDYDPQEYGIPPSAIQPYEDPSLALSLHDEDLWYQRGAALGYDRGLGTGDSAWRRYEQWNQEYNKRRAFQQRWGL